MGKTPSLMTTKVHPSDPGSFQEASGLKLHMGVAEQGKLFALEGDHQKALLYYRSAMHMCVKAGDPEVFFRTYLESALESMEILEFHEEVLKYCKEAIELYEKNPPASEIARIDLAHIYQKRGIILLKSGKKEEAREALKIALERIKEENGRLPLSETLLRWLQVGYHLDPKRIYSEQKKCQYFSVRKENVNPDMAIRLPDEQLLPMG